MRNIQMPAQSGNSNKRIIQLRVESFQYEGATGPCVANVSFSVSPGSATCLVGPIGSGKSTVLSLAAGLFPRFLRGNFIGERKIARPSEDDNDLSTCNAYLFQAPDANFCSTTVRDELAFALDSSTLSATQAQQRLAEILEEFELLQVVDSRIYELSVGWRQWLAIAACFAGRPQVLFLDEPTAHLDVLHQARLLEIIRNHLKAPSAGAVVVATHDLAFVDAMKAHRIEIGAKYPKAPITNDTHTLVRAVSGPKVLMKLDRVAFHYPGRETLFHDTCVSIREGDCLVITGRNGSGKSTFARVLAGLQRPTSGEIILPPDEKLNLPDPRLVGYVTQTPGTQLFGRTIGEEVRLTPQAVGAKIEINKLGNVLPFIDNTRDPWTLSHGQRRILQIAAFSQLPKILILDEPPVEFGKHRSEILLRALDGYPGPGRALVICTLEPKPWSRIATSCLEFQPGECPVKRDLSSPNVEITENQDLALTSAARKGNSSKGPVTISKPWGQGETEVTNDAIGVAQAVLGPAVAHPGARAALLVSLLFGILADPLGLVWFVSLGLVCVWLTGWRRLGRPILWGPPLVVGIAGLVMAWLGTGNTGIDPLTACLVPGARMLVVCASGLAFVGLLSEREVAFLLCRLHAKPIAIAVSAAYRSVPLAMETARELRWGLAARGLSAKPSKPKTWIFGTIRLLSTFVLGLLEHSDSLATVIQIRNLKTPGRFLARPVSLGKSVALTVLAATNLTILIVLLWSIG